MTILEKNKLPWGKMVLRRHPPRALKGGVYRPILGFDTETLDGYAKIIACSDNTFSSIPKVSDALDFLTQSKYRSTINFFFNIQFDLEAILKYLPRGRLEEIATTGETHYDGIDISYIPDKVFTLSKHKNSWDYYDIYQFYEMSLEKASRDYIGGVKNKEGLDRALIGSSREYWMQNYDDIVRYCIDDCKLTAQLGEVLQAEVYNTMGRYPKSYVSKAALSEFYFRSTCHIPDVTSIPKDALRYAFESYHGGRFEVTERGKIGVCTNLDINSAYPSEIANLIDLDLGHWERVKKPSRDAYYGFYLAKVTIPYMHLCPLPKRWKGTVIYPYGQWHGYFSRQELLSLPEGCKYESIAGFEFYPDRIEYPFREEVERLYEKKRMASKKSYQYSLYKITLNSLYGKFYQKWRRPDGLWQTGLLFNPVYASIITAGTRIKLYRMAASYGSRTVSMATDGILIRGKVDYASNKLLGDWSRDDPAETTILRSGIYAYGDELKQRGVMKTRYYHTPYGDFDNLFDYIRCFPGMKKYPIKTNRPIHMKEALASSEKWDIEDINVFTDFKQAFDLNTDIKRIFDKNDITGEELLRSRLTSEPRSLWINPYKD